MTQRQAGFRLEQDLEAEIAEKVTGPASSVDNNIAVFDGTTGKLVKDSGVPISDIATASASVMRVFLRG